MRQLVERLLRLMGLLRGFYMEILLTQIAGFRERATLIFGSQRVGRTAIYMETMVLRLLQST